MSPRDVTVGVIGSWLQGEEGGVFEVIWYAVFNPFASGGGYARVGYPLRSVESSTQLLLVLRPDQARY
jgi:hypothetical protein